MSPPVSDLFRVQSIANAGRGVVASQDLARDTIVLGNVGPACYHVIFHHYRKECCAHCFFYDRGRNLPVRSLGKAFCTSACQCAWVKTQGELGISAWEKIDTFAKAKKLKAQPFEDAIKPSRSTIETAWQIADDKAGLLQQARLSTVNKAVRKKAKAIEDECSRFVDSNILSYFLSGLLHIDSPQDDVVSLTREDSYESELDLQTHCNSYLQLTSILPIELLPNLTSDLCQMMVSVASRNAFGIRAGSDDNEEYLGYGVYPAASYFNHSCTPNITKRRIGRAWEFRAVQDIAAGTECCITYLGGDEKDMAADERRARLKEHWGFDCGCERCTKDETDKDEQNTKS